MHMHRDPSFFLAKSMGAPYGEVEGRTHPFCEEVVQLFLDSCKFSWAHAIETRFWRCRSLVLQVNAMRNRTIRSWAWTLKHVGKLLAKRLPLVLPRGSYVHRTSRPIPLHGGKRCRSSKHTRAKQAKPSRYTFLAHHFHDRLQAT